METLLESLLQLGEALLALFVNLGSLLVPWTPLFAWIAFWTLGVNWVSLRRILLHEGGLIGVLLIWFTMILVWGTVSPPDGGYHHIFGLQLSNFVGKTVYTTSLFTIMFLCGAVQLSGCCAGWTPADETVELDTQPPSAGH